MASQKASSLDKDLAFLSGTDANKRHSTKGNAGPKVHIGSVEDQLSAPGVLDHSEYLERPFAQFAVALIHICPNCR